MTPVLGLLAIAAGWWAAIELMCYATGMRELKIAAIAAVGACLPYMPDLVALLFLPAPVASALCAAILAAAYAVRPKDAPPPTPPVAK